MTITCLVVDDHPAVLDAISRCLTQSGITIVGRASDGEDAKAKIEAVRPAVALVDLRMPRLGGLELARWAAVAVPETAIIFYTGNGDQGELVSALDAGGRGFVLKEAPVVDLVRAVRTVAAGGIYVDPVLGGAVATSAGEGLSLTEREREVLRLLADGFGNEGIGERLFISSETVRAHLRKAMRKLHVTTRTGAVATAIRRSLIV